MKNCHFLRRSTAFVVNFAFVLSFITIGTLSPKAQSRTVNENNFRKYAVADSVTSLIRNKSNDFAVVRINSLEDRANATRHGKIVEDYGLFVVLAKNEDSSGIEAQILETDVNLPAGKFEPLENSLLTTVKPNKTPENARGKDYYVVQVGSIARDEWLNSFEEIGAEVIQYVPHQAFFVYADGAAIAKIAGHSRVRWVGQYAANMKISPFTNQFKNETDAPTARFDVAVFARADLLAVRNQIASITGGEILNVVELPKNFFNVIEVEIPLADVEKIASLKDVVRIDPSIIAEPEDERAAQIVAGNYLNTTTLAGPGYDPLTQFGADGSNVTIAIADNGILIPGAGNFYITSANTVNGPLRGASAGTSGHGHQVATMAAGGTPFAPLDPLGYVYAMGVAPKSHLINVPYLRGGYSGGYSGTVNDTVTTAGPNGVKGSIINNSWGSGTNGNSYDSLAAQYDGFVQDASSAPTIDPITICFSAGNSGTSGLTRPKMSKNTIATANAENLRPELTSSANNIDDLSNTSSRGPAADGRIKPDISAPGSGIAAGNYSSSNCNIDAFHCWGSGTSFASPQIAGAAALFTQFWKNGNNGINPSPSLIKAAILNTAQEMNGVGSSAVIPNGNEGWGRVNMKYMLNTGVPMRYINEETTFANPGETAVYTGTVSDSTKPFRVTLVWTDPPGVSDPALVNNLDLTVTVGANVYKGNVFTNGVSTTGGNADTRNNVENVFLPAGIPAGTQVTVEVRATALNGNGDITNSDPTDQHFSLVGYNLTNIIVDPFNVKKSDFDGDGKADISVFRPSEGNWYVQGSTSGFTAYTFGASNDVIVPGDYDGDGKTDYAVFRAGIWYIQRSTEGFTASAFGAATDLPVQGDYDGDGKTDIAVFRPSEGNWYILGSNAGFSAVTFGLGTDKPVQEDYDGDGKTDVAVFRASDNAWYILQSAAGFTASIFGAATDILTPGDFDGDGKADVAVFRPSNGTWYIQGSASGFSAVVFGANGDVPVHSDFDGDGKTDIGVFRNGTWYWLNSSNSAFNAYTFGLGTDKPTQSGYQP